MNDNTSKNPLKPVTDFLNRFNVVIFIVVVVGGLVAAILVLSQILNIPYGPDILNPNTGANAFDEATIQRVDKLRTSDTNVTNQSEPTGKINPFSE